MGTCAVNIYPASYGNPGNKGGGRTPEWFKVELRKIGTRKESLKFLTDVCAGKHGAAAFIQGMHFVADRGFGKVPSVSEVRGSDEPLVIILKKGY